MLSDLKTPWCITKDLDETAQLRKHIEPPKHELRLTRNENTQGLGMASAAVPAKTGRNNHAWQRQTSTSWRDVFIVSRNSSEMSHSVEYRA